MINLLALIRPRHWIKNLLVFAPLVFSQDITAARLADTALAFLAFCLIASSVYVINDIADAEADRQHPEKRRRPVAAGIVAPATAAALAVCLIAGGVLLVARLPWQTEAVFAAYFLLNMAYSLGLKRLVIIDVMIIAAGFVMRVLAGGFAASIYVSQWILVCTFFASLFLGFGKRKNETAVMEEDGRHHRAVLLHYTPDFLNQLIGLTAAMTIMSYALYTVDALTVLRLGTDKLTYTIPFVVYGVFRYFHIMYNKQSGGDPTRIFTTDLPLMLDAALWLGAFVLIARA